MQCIYYLDDFSKDIFTINYEILFFISIHNLDMGVAIWKKVLLKENVFSLFNLNLLLVFSFSFIPTIFGFN